MLQNIDLRVKTAALAVGAVMITAIVGVTSWIVSATDPAASTVMITNMGSNSGGSGSILSSSNASSQILTNSHVCEVVANGGLVHTGTGSHAVVSYRQSTLHDLCLITVAANLGISTPLANASPPNLSAATVSGHPQLYPLTIAQGTFSGNRVITIFVGLENCEPQDYEDPDTGMFCLFLGQKPKLKNFESRFVTALIQPGSSGSAIYNDAGEISAVVFAGSGGIGYAFAVPYEYVANFVKIEAKTIAPIFPTMNPLAKKKNRRAEFERFRDLCEEHGTRLGNTLCSTALDTYIYE